MLQLRADVTPQQIKDVESAIRELGLRSLLVLGETAATLQVIGDETGKDLPVIADPSHSTGKMALVTPIALAAVAAGAHGLILNVRREADGPVIEYSLNGMTMKAAYCDYEQALMPKEFQKLAAAATTLHASVAAAAK